MRKSIGAEKIERKKKVLRLVRSVSSEYSSYSLYQIASILRLVHRNFKHIELSAKEAKCVFKSVSSLERRIANYLINQESPSSMAKGVFNICCEIRKQAGLASMSGKTRIHSNRLLESAGVHAMMLNRVRPKNLRVGPLDVLQKTPDIIFRVSSCEKGGTGKIIRVPSIEETLIKEIGSETIMFLGIPRSIEEVKKISNDKLASLISSKRERSVVLEESGSSVLLQRLCARNENWPNLPAY